MNYKILLLAFSIASITSCSTAYKAGQTPDDVYYSPAKEYTVKKEREKEDRYDDYARNQEDQYLRMKVRNRNRWSSIDDYEYWYDSRYDRCVCNYNYHNTFGWNNWHWNRPTWGNYYGGGWYNGWGGGYPVVINKYVPRPSNVNRPSLGGYKNNSGYNNNNVGNTFKKIFSSEGSGSYSNSNSGSTYSTGTPSRTYNPGSSSSSSSSSGSRTSSGSSSSSGGSVSRPARGGN